MNFNEFQNDKLSIKELKKAKGGEVPANAGRNIMWSGPITDLGRRDYKSEDDSAAEEVA